MPRLLAALVSLAVVLPAAAQTPPSTLTYIPPTVPPAVDPVSVLVRLIGLTLATVLVCGGMIWWARRANRAKLLASPNAGRLQSEGTLALDARNRLHVIRVDGQQVVVTTDGTGLRSITPLQERFDAVLTEEGAGDLSADEVAAGADDPAPAETELTS